MARLRAALPIVILATASAFPQSCTLRAQNCGEDRALAASLQARLNDWPSLARYRDANAQLSPPAKDEARVVFLGDSITDSWDNPGSGGFFSGKPYINRGISSQTTSQMLIRFRPDVIALKPSVVVILAGTNDVAGVTGPTTLRAIEDNLRSMAELARANDIRVVLASLLPTNDYERDKNGRQIIHSTNRPPDQIKALNEWIQAYAMEHDHTYLDYYSAMVDENGSLQQELTDDGIHATENGYAVMAPLAEQAIATARKKKS